MDKTLSLWQQVTWFSALEKTKKLRLTVMFNSFINFILSEVKKILVSIVMYGKSDYDFEVTMEPFITTLMTYHFLYWFEKKRKHILTDGTKIDTCIWWRIAIAPIEYVVFKKYQCIVKMSDVILFALTAYA